ncbi:MAG: hypothetical protein E6J24_02125 [Chloroflexi bacterium]|nr:MAG: hypothetical protein E6J24_02125 [Chloroflexota bacterium]
MTRDAVAKVIQRAISDGSFRNQLTRDTTTALRGFDLTPTEIAAIKSGDSGRISSLGVDLRMSKAFGLAATDGRAESVLTTGADSSLASGVNSGTNSSLTSGSDAGLTAGVNSGTNSALTGGVNSSANGVETIDGGAGGSADLSGGENAGHQVVQWDGNDDAPLSTVIPGEPAHAFGAQTPEGGAFGDSALTAGDEGYLPSVNYASTSEGGAQDSSAGFATDEGQLTNALNMGTGEGGATTPAEAGEGPNITP